MADRIGSKNVRIVRSPEMEKAKLRSWREPAEQEGRDRRPGLFSVTGEFIQLPEVKDQDRGDAEHGRLA